MKTSHSAASMSGPNQEGAATNSHKKQQEAALAAADLLL
jgi:hypothetical protein